MQTIASGQGIAGTRAAPTKTVVNDQRIGLRADWGDTFWRDGNQYKRVKIQANKGADNPTIRALAQKDSHKILAEADLEIGALSDDEAIDQLFEDLAEDAKTRD